MNELALTVLARTGEGQKSGPIGFAVILVLCVAAYFLFKSMSKHLKRVREEFPTDEKPAAEQAPLAGARAEVVRNHAAAPDEPTDPNEPPATPPGGPAA